jgi:hypothetical protein
MLCVRCHKELNHIPWSGKQLFYCGNEKCANYRTPVPVPEEPIKPVKAETKVRASKKGKKLSQARIKGSP